MKMISKSDVLSLDEDKVPALHIDYSFIRWLFLGYHEIW